MRESAGHFDFGHFYFCPKMISSRLSFSWDWKKSCVLLDLSQSGFSAGFYKHFLWIFHLFMKNGLLRKVGFGHFFEFVQKNVQNGGKRVYKYTIKM